MPRYDADGVRAPAALPIVTIERGAVRFTRRELREVAGVSQSQLAVHVERLQQVLEGGLVLGPHEERARELLLLLAGAAAVGQRELVVRPELRERAPVDLLERELADDDANICLFRRVLDAGGRSKSFINGTSVTLSQMRDLAEHLIDIHGQHEHQTLLKRDAQLSLLDDFAGNTTLLADVAAKHGAWSQLANMRVAREANEAAIARELDWVRAQLA